MVRRLAIELTGTQAHGLLLSTPASASGMTVDKALCVSLVAEDDDQPFDVAARVVDALATAGVGRVETIAVVGRADVELRMLTVPPVPDEELPALVRFQATQELPGLDAGAPLDYIPLGKTDGESRRVLAAVLKPGVKPRLEKICHDAKLTLSRIVLRSAATASLATREQPRLAQGCCLLVEVLGRRVELAAIHDRQIVFLRHMLLPDDPSEADDALVAEIRRTLVIVASQEGADEVGPVALVGEGPARQELAEQLTEAVGVPVLLVEPVPGSVSVARDVELSTDDRHHAAALLGAAADESAGRRPAFDFLHPRQPPTPPSRGRLYVLAGMAVAAALVGLVSVNQIQKSNLTNDVRRLSRESESLKPRIKKADAVIGSTEQVHEWLGDEVVWLDELRWLSAQLPSSEDARLTSLHLFSNDRGREMVLDGLAADGETKAALDRSLQDAAHQLVPRTSDDLGDGMYRIKFRSSVRFKKEP